MSPHRFTRLFTQPPSAAALVLCAAFPLAAGCDDAAPPTPSPAPASSAATTAKAASSASASAAPSDLQARAQALAKRFIIVDGHVDLPYRLEASKDKKTGALTEDPTQRTEKGDFDHPRAKAGGLDAPFMSIYIPAKHQTEGGAKALADELIDMVEGLIAKAPDKFAPGHSVADVQRAFGEKKIALPMGIENGAAIEGKLENLKHFHERGVRYITLTHSKDNRICDSSYDDAHKHKGLSDFGVKVVEEMNRLGIMVDVSHVSDDAFHDVMKVTKVPVIASHSSVRHYTPGFERNMADDMIKKLAKNGGVIMINYGSGFLDHDVRMARKKLRDATKLFMESNKLEQRRDPKVELFIDKYKKTNDVPYATVQTVADHINHVVKLVGIDHVGLGSDFDGVGDSLPTELKDASQIPNLLRVLLERGYKEDAIEKICSGNVLRVWKQVEDHAKKQ
jgi:membrane dipeptidase